MDTITFEDFFGVETGCEWEVVSTTIGGEVVSRYRPDAAAFDQHYAKEKLENNEILVPTSAAEVRPLISFTREWEDSSDWNQYVKVKIAQDVKTGYFLIFTEYPAGYSSYTYDPEEVRRVYLTNDPEWIYDFAIDSNLRDLECVKRYFLDYFAEKSLL